MNRALKEAEDGLMVLNLVCEAYVLARFRAALPRDKSGTSSLRLDTIVAEGFVH